jgi:hypothetical protein
MPAFTVEPLSTALLNPCALTKPTPVEDVVDAAVVVLSE